MIMQLFGTVTKTRQLFMIERTVKGEAKLTTRLKLPEASVVVTLVAPLQDSDTVALDKTGLRGRGEGFEQVRLLADTRAWDTVVKSVPFATEAVATTTARTMSIAGSNFAISVCVSEMYTREALWREESNCF